MQSTTNVYALPLGSEARIERIVSDSPGHPGPYKGAVDFAVEIGTPVLAPLDGEVVTVVDNHDLHGATPDFADQANYVQIQHPNGEVSDLMHLAKDAVLIKAGDRVTIGQAIAKTGLSGWMTAPHLHWLVYKRDASPAGFTGLRITLGYSSAHTLYE